MKSKEEQEAAALEAAQKEAELKAEAEAKAEAERLEAEKLAADKEAKKPAKKAKAKQKEEISNEELAQNLKPRYHLVNVPNGDGWKQISKEDFTDVDAFAILEFWDTLEGFDKEKAIKSIFE